MQHGSMNKLCERNTRKYLSILRKIEAKKYKTPFLDNKTSRNSSHKLLVTCTGSLDKIMVHIDGLEVVKGLHSLGQ
jgi:hypothetical protein